MMKRCKTKMYTFSPAIQTLFWSHYKRSVLSALPYHNSYLHSWCTFLPLSQYTFRLELNKMVKLQSPQHTATWKIRHKLLAMNWMCMIHHEYAVLQYLHRSCPLLFHISTAFKARFKTRDTVSRMNDTFGCSRHRSRILDKYVKWADMTSSRSRAAANASWNSMPTEWRIWTNQLTILPIITILTYSNNIGLWYDC